MTMQTLSYQVSFATPAFLGNAEQQAQRRTPPFKALLRQWWRVVKAPDVGYDHQKLLRLENDLFGSAGDDIGGGRSKVQCRIHLAYKIRARVRPSPAVIAGKCQRPSDFDFPATA